LVTQVRSRPLTTSHTRAVPSLLAVANSRPLELTPLPQGATY
jgi:hypothetical protein